MTSKHARPPQIQDLIAHYLAINYPSVLPSFIDASQALPPDTTKAPVPDLRTLVEDFRSHEAAEKLAAIRLAEDEDMELGSANGAGLGAGHWKKMRIGDILKIQLSPNLHLEGEKRSIEGISAVNLLTVGQASLPRRWFDTTTATYRAEYMPTILTSSVDRSLKLIDYMTGEVERILEPHKAAVLCFDTHPLNSRYLLSGSMDGSTVLTDLITGEPLQTFKSSKFVVRVAFSPDGRYFATASYDRHVVIYRATSSAVPLTQVDEDDALILDDTDDIALASDPTLRYEEVKRIKVDSNPESIVFHPASTYLLYTLRSSHLMYYVKLPAPDTAQTDQGAATRGSDDWSIITKSFNPHPMDLHISFAVLNMAVHPSGKLIACQTGDHRGGSGERILLYGIEPHETERLACLWTGCDTDDFVLPRMSWLPDGSGLVTTTPNGYLNLISLSGEVRSRVKIHGSVLLSGQGSSEVVRDCCIVQTGEGNDQWEVVSVGYDRVVRVSKPNKRTPR